MRHRSLAAALLRVASEASDCPLVSIEDAAIVDFSRLRVLDTDSFSPISKRLRRSPYYCVSSFRPDMESGLQFEPNHFNVNLERTSFPDALFDVVVTSDVMEHVRDIDAAHAEVSRILKPGGYYVFTVPYDENCKTHHTLVETCGPVDRFLVPPQYHGDPLTGGILAYRVFGRALFSDLERVGFEVEFFRVSDSSALIIDGDVFIARKRAPTNE